jgi:hypothetical protein
MNLRNKTLIMLMAAVLFAGCDFTVPLVTTPGMDIDKSLLGLWQGTGDDGKIEQLLVLELDAREYLVSYPSASKDGMFARACLCRADNQTLVQIKWVGTANGNPPDDNRVFQYASYTVSGDKMSVRFLNNEVVNKDAASSAELLKSIAANRDKPDLFRTAAVFTKVSK